MQTIYLDVLLFFNFCVNYFLLRGTACLTHTPCRIPRCLVSALLGSLFSLA
ncbi:MAG: sigma-E processing peptidase SpoIIGA, partial [Ruminococcus sp.]